MKSKLILLASVITLTGCSTITGKLGLRELSCGEEVLLQVKAQTSLAEQVKMLHDANVISDGNKESAVSLLKGSIIATDEIEALCEVAEKQCQETPDECGINDIEIDAKIDAVSNVLSEVGKLIRVERVGEFNE